jgi:hypothetical protein
MDGLLLNACRQEQGDRKANCIYGRSVKYSIGATLRSSTTVELVETECKCSHFSVIRHFNRTMYCGYEASSKA